MMTRDISINLLTNFDCMCFLKKQIKGSPPKTNRQIKTKHTVDRTKCFTSNLLNDGFHALSGIIG